jgi:hypothetical protein
LDFRKIHFFGALNDFGVEGYYRFGFYKQREPFQGADDIFKPNAARKPFAGPEINPASRGQINVPDSGAIHNRSYQKRIATVKFIVDGPANRIIKMMEY